MPVHRRRGLYLDGYDPPIGRLQHAVDLALVAVAEMAHLGLKLCGTLELPGVVETVWVRHPRPEPVPARVVPDACTDLIWVDGDLLVAGPDTQAHVATIAAGSEYAAVRFVPGAGPTVLGVPGHELRDGRIPLAALWPAAEVRRLADRVSAAHDRTGVLAGAVAERLGCTGEPDSTAVAVVARQRAGMSVAATARAVGWSERQLRRRCLAAFGYGPKVLARILRFRQALALARSGVPFADVAYRVQYADQAHLAREVRALAGVPLRELMR